jgi:serine/threonine-protein kinase ULK2
MPSENLTNICA